MIEILIPSLEKEVDESGKLRKRFRIEILFNGRKHFVLRRHSEFQNLHRKLRKIALTPDFPSKRHTHLRTKPLEQRRQELEDYIQDILYQNEEVPQMLLDFLDIKHFHSGNKISSLESLDDTSPQMHRCQLQHRVIGFSRDPYITEHASDLPDIVMDGVLQGLYRRDVQVSFNTSTKPSPSERACLVPIVTLQAPALPAL